MSNLLEKVNKATDNFYAAVGATILPDYDGPGKKIIGAVEVALGTAGWAASKAIHKAQGPLGHWINKKTGCDPIADCAEDCKWMIEAGLDHLK